MSKEKVGVEFANGILSSKPKFRRFVLVLGMILLTFILVLGYGFYTGSIQYNRTVTTEKTK